MVVSCKPIVRDAILQPNKSFHIRNGIIFYSISILLSTKFHTFLFFHNFISVDVVGCLVDTLLKGRPHGMHLKYGTNITTTRAIVVAIV